MIGNVAVEPQSTEPAVRQIGMDLLAQPPLRANAEAIANDAHPDHQLGIDRGPPDVAIVGAQVRANLGQVDEPVDLAKQVTVGDVPLQAEAIKQRLLPYTTIQLDRCPASSRQESLSGLEGRAGMEG
jgi:hypothetical protein